MSNNTDRSTRRFQLLLYAATALYVLNLLVQTAEFDNNAAQRFPFLFGSLTLVFAVVLLVYLLTPEALSARLPRIQGKDTADLEAVPEMEQQGSNWKTSRTVLFTVLFPLVVYVFGFAIGISVWIFAFTYFLRRNLRESIVVTVAVVALWWILFVNLLGIIFYEGVIF